MLTDDENIKNNSKVVNGKNSKLLILNILNNLFITNKSQFSFYRVATLGHVQNLPSQIWELLTNQGLGVLVIVKNK